ncbi:MAG: hypothetical protein ACI8Y4_005449 [Candidatus Poriferisodalaceae bacterium]|jgi:hypothetical protein
MVRDHQATEATHAALVSSMGERAMTDAAATIAAFNAYPRIADATGIPLEDAKAAGTADLPMELGLNELNRPDAKT